MAVNNKDLLYPESWEEAYTECMTHEYAYQRGFSEWRNESHEGENYNYQLFLPDKGLKVFRQFDLALGKITRSAVIPSKATVSSWDSPNNCFWVNDGTRRPVWRNTFCNFIIGVFTSHYFENGQGLTVRLVNGNPDWESANEMHNKWISGGYEKDSFYGADEGVWNKTGHLSAVDYAAKGGLAVCSWYQPGKDGHVAVLTGNIESGGTAGDVEIFQAGLYWGIMPLAKGFGLANVPNVSFFLWQKK